MEKIIFEKNKNLRVTPTNTLIVHLVGPTGAGKTSLSNRWLYQVFPEVTYQTTLPNISNKIITTPQIKESLINKVQNIVNNLHNEFNKLMKEMEDNPDEELIDLKASEIASADNELNTIRNMYATQNAAGHTHKIIFYDWAGNVNLKMFQNTYLTQLAEKLSNKKSVQRHVVVGVADPLNPASVDEIKNSFDKFNELKDKDIEHKINYLLFVNKSDLIENNISSEFSANNTIVQRFFEKINQLSNERNINLIIGSARTGENVMDALDRILDLHHHKEN